MSVRLHEEIPDEGGDAACTISVFEENGNLCIELEREDLYGHCTYPTAVLSREGAESLLSLVTAFLSDDAATATGSEH